MQHWLNCGRKEYMFQYLLNTIVLNVMGFPFHKKDKFNVVKVTIEQDSISVISNFKPQTTVK